MTWQVILGGVVWGLALTQVVTLVLAAFRLARRSSE